MSEEENFQTAKRTNNPMTAPFYGMIEEVHVMLVHPGKEFVTEMVDLLESYSYKVTTVDMVLTAMLKLFKGEEKIDVMIINIHSPNSLYFELLEQAVSLDIVSLFICDELNKLLVKKALDYGAYLYLKKPLDEEIVKYLWQFVLGRKIQKEKARKALEANGDQENIDDIGNNNIVGSNGKYKLSRKRSRKSTKEINEGESQKIASNTIARQKDGIEWTDDLHAKFVIASQQLGEGKCLPRDILKLMNVPDLTRGQVASHLQKCRNNTWRPPGERKCTRQGFLICSQQRNSYRKYGTMPRFNTHVPNQIEKGPEFAPIMTNNVFTGSTQQHQLYLPQFQVQPHYLNSSLLVQNNVGDGALQQPLFEMLGLEGPTIGKTNYRSGMAFNNGDHHDYGLKHYTQNDYSLDLNGITYSSNAVISGIDIENEINKLEEANANSQQYIGEQNMFDPNNIVTTSNASDIEGSDSKEEEDIDVYFNFDNMDDLFHNLEPPNEHSSQFDQVYSGDQVTAKTTVQFPEIANFNDESSI